VSQIISKNNALHSQSLIDIKTLFFYNWLSRIIPFAHSAGTTQWGASPDLAQKKKPAAECDAVISVQITAPWKRRGSKRVTPHCFPERHFLL